MSSSANDFLSENPSTDSVAIVSGGLDSTTLVYDMLDKGLRPHMLSFDYGQRHSKELVFAQLTARNLGLPHDIIHLYDISHLIGNSALTVSCSCSKGPDYEGPSRECDLHGENPVKVPEGHYAEENMKATVVPNRNMMMLSMAAAVAVNNGAKTIGIGVHAGDHFVYPDCRPEFIGAMSLTVAMANEGFHQFDIEPVQKKTPEGFDQEGWQHQTGSFPLPDLRERFGPIYAPYLHHSKADIAYHALELGVPLHLTWSCYKGEEYHCGRCGTCVERLEAIDDAAKRWGSGIVNDLDNTIYQDKEYWRTAVKKTVSNANAD